MMDGSYPPGVSGWMIDGIDPVEPPRTCENCEYWFNGSCTMAEAGYTAEEIDAMTDDEYTQLVSRDPDDYCDEHRFMED